MPEFVFFFENVLNFCSLFMWTTITQWGRKHQKVPVQQSKNSQLQVKVLNSNLTLGKV